MPVYEYSCDRCGDFTAMTSMAKFREPSPCPACGEPSPRVLLTPPAFSGMQAAARIAHATNERARHEPLHSSAVERRHGAGCACCAPTKSAAATRTAASGAKSFPGKRPWMISH